MAGCNRTVVFKYVGFEGKSFEEMPKGEFLRLAVNPYNGKVVLSFNDCARYADAVEDVFEQLSRSLRMLRFATAGSAGLHEFAEICDGNMEMADFSPVMLKAGDSVRASA